MEFFPKNSTDPMGLSLFDSLGGESRLRAIIDTFVDRVFEDRMIGFFFSERGPEPDQRIGISTRCQVSRRRHRI